MFFFMVAMLAIVLAVAGCARTEIGNQQSTIETQSTIIPETKTLPVQQTRAYAMNEIALHATAEDCWVVIDDNVYDLTLYIMTRAEGQIVLADCGKDVTALFVDPKDPKGNNAGATLLDFYIGALQT